MYFIHFVKPPEIQIPQDLDLFGSSIRAVVSIAQRPPASLLATDLTIDASLWSETDTETPCLTQEYRWERGMSELVMEFDTTNVNVIWPVRIKAAVAAQNANDLLPLLVSRHGSMLEEPCVQTVWSDLLDPGQSVKPDRLVERRFVLSNQRTLKMWESAETGPGRQLKSAGIHLLAYLDSIISLQSDSVPELEHKIASATYKKVHIVDVGSGCGVVGLGVAQLIPDCHVVLLDRKEAGDIVRQNIGEMYAAVLSEARFQYLAQDCVGVEEGGVKFADIIFLVDESSEKGETVQTEALLGKLMRRFPRATIVIAGETRGNIEGPSSLTGILRLSKRNLCHTRLVPLLASTMASGEGRGVAFPWRFIQEH